MASESAKATQVSKGERHLRIAERLVLASGIVLFCFLVTRLGADNILANLRLVGWGIFVIIAAEILAFLANTLGWRAAFPRQETVPSFGQLLLARIAGDGVNYLTPTATMGGEFVRVRMLQGQAPVPSLAASVMVAKLTQTIGLLVFVSCGLLAVINELRLPSSVKWGILASLVVFAAMISGLLLMQRRGLLTPALEFAVRGLRLRFLTRFRAPLEQLDAEMARVHRESSFRIFLSVGFFALGFAQGVIDTYLIIWFFGIPVSLKLALAIEVLRVVLNNLTFLSPSERALRKQAKPLPLPCSASAQRKDSLPASSIGFVSSHGPSSGSPFWPTSRFASINSGLTGNFGALNPCPSGEQRRQDGGMSNPLSVSLSSPRAPARFVRLTNGIRSKKSLSAAWKVR